ncbi:hypothetical protein KODAMA_01780 [Serratia phage vB_SmaM-Kodama]|nr:hypothetical protein KODAMA_01780 [Serratia phage vB_SmaM-Kodama]
MEQIQNAGTEHEAGKSQFDFDLLVEVVKENIKLNSSAPNLRFGESSFFPLFRVNVAHANSSKSLYDIYLDSFGEQDRKELTCRTCKRWLEANGNLVTIGAGGEVSSVAFNTETGKLAELPVEVSNLLLKLQSAVERSPVNGYRTLSRGSDTAVPNDGRWLHFHGTLGSIPLNPVKVNYAGEENAAAEKVLVMRNALNRWSLDILSHAKALATYGALRNHRHRNRIKQYVDNAKLYHAIKDNRKRDALVWLWANTLTPDQTNVVGTSLGMLFDALVEGGEDLALTRYIRETDGVNYQRPTEEPTVRELDEAQELVSKNGWDRSFHRTAAKLEDIQYLFWVPGETKQEEGRQGVFSQVKTKDAQPEKAAVEGGRISILDFMSKVVPNATSIQFKFNPRGVFNFLFYTKAEFADAPPILKWDREDRRNTVSGYQYSQSIYPEYAGIDSPRVDVIGITVPPETWANPEMEYGTLKEPVFLLKGAYDIRNSQSALFPENMRHELHGSRRVIEAFSSSTPLADKVGVTGITPINFSQLTAEVVTKDGEKVNYSFIGNH